MVFSAVEDQCTAGSDISEPQPSSSIRSTVEKLLLVKLQKVSNILECQYGLLTRLEKEDLLTDREVLCINAEKIEFQRAEKLIEIIADRLNTDTTSCYAILFLQALRRTGQSHVANALLSGMHV